MPVIAPLEGMPSSAQPEPEEVAESIRLDD